MSQDTSLNMEPIGKKEERTTQEHLSLEFRAGSNGLSWGLIERRVEDRVGWRDLFVAYAPRSVEG